MHKKRLTNASGSIEVINCFFFLNKNIYFKKMTTAVYSEHKQKKLAQEIYTQMEKL